VPQFEKALKNVLAARKQLGAIWRECMGQHYPAMSMIFVADLLDNPGKIELEATAVVPVA
jgi:enamine deaminase RidA (YjgF/YER057c/UK114 family)